MASWRNNLAWLILVIGALMSLSTCFFSRDMFVYLGIVGVPCLIVLFVFLTSLLIGDQLTPQGLMPSSRCSLALACGLSIFIFAFTLCLLLRVPFLPVFLVMAAVTWALSMFRRRPLELVYRHLDLKESLAMVLLVLGLAMGFLSALTPSVSYDVLEYHLPLVREWLQSGFLGAIRNNFYTLMPAGTEALYGVAGSIARNAESTAKYVNFGLFACSTMMVYALARLLGASLFPALLMAAAFTVHRTSMRIYVDAFADMGSVCFVMSSMIALVAWFQSKRRSLLVIAGALAGMAMGTKASLAGIYIAPVTIGLLIAVLAARRSEHRIGWGAVVLFLAPMAVAFAPWMIRGYHLTGNPVSPFLNSIFARDPWSMETERLWLQMHGWSTPFSIEHLRNVALRIELLGAAWVLGAVAALVIMRSSSRIVPAVALAGFVIYCLLTGAPDRFAQPLVALMMASTAVALSPLLQVEQWRKPAAVLLMLAALQPTWRSVQNVAVGGMVEYASLLDRQTFLQRYLPMDMFAATDLIPEEGRLLMLYEARAQYVESPHTFNTVFDRSPLLEIMRNTGGGSIEEKLRANGYTHVLINESELGRLIEMQASPETSNQPLFRQIRQIRGGMRRQQEFAAQLQWYLPYERMKATEAELMEIRNFTARCAERAPKEGFINLSGTLMLMIAPISEPSAGENKTAPRVETP